MKPTWWGPPTPQETTVTRADAPKVLEYSDIRWELEAFGGGTRLTLWHNIDRRFISWGAAGWHISFDVLGGPPPRAFFRAPRRAPGREVRRRPRLSGPRRPRGARHRTWSSPLPHR